MHLTEDLLWHVKTWTIPEAMSLLPGRMDSVEAHAQMFAIGLQESKFTHRTQMRNGPARGLWQFEKDGGIKGVLTHELTKPIIIPICDLLCVAPTSVACHDAVEYHDVLAACFARLLLWTDPRACPDSHHAAVGWAMYLNTWRPGDPRPKDWLGNFEKAWGVVSS